VLWLGAIVLLVRAVVARIDTMPHPPHWNDSYVLAGAASNFVSHPAQLYDAARTQIGASTAQRAYIYPPAGLIPFLPLVPVTRSFGLATASTVWSVIDVASLLAAVTLFGRQLRISWPRLAPFAVLISVSGALLVEIHSGQVNGLVLLLLALSWRWYPGDGAGVALGLALALKPVAPLLLLIPVLRGRPRVALVAVVTMALVTLPFLLFLGVDGTGFYLTRFLPYFAGFDAHDVDNFSVANILQVWLSGRTLSPHAGALSPLHLGALALASLWLMRAGLVVALVVAARRSDRSDVELSALALATVPVFAATTWPHYFLYLAPLLLVFLASPSLRVRRVTWVAAVLAMWDGIDTELWVYDPHVSRVAHNLARFAQAELIPLVGAAVVLAVFLRGRAAARGRRGGASPPPMAHAT